MHEGVFAVIIFYIMAGHVVTKLFAERIKIHSLIKKLLIFYIERSLRIFPMYLAIFFFSLLFFIVTDYGHPIVNSHNLIFNVTVVPLNYYMYLKDSIVILTTTNPPWWVIPPAWSLGAELQAYIILPFLLVYRTLGLIVYWLSYVVYSLANLNIIHSDYFGYRLIPGTIFIFLSGAYLQKILSNRTAKYEIFSLISMYTVSLFWFIYFVLIKQYIGTYTRETLLGILIGVPLVYLLLRCKIENVLRKRFNQFLGKLSYGLFLSHFTSFYIIDYFRLKLNLSEMILASTVISVLISTIFIILVENKVERFRFALTKGNILTFNLQKV